MLTLRWRSMSDASHINPDHYLETDAGRVFTAERNAEAWELAYQKLDSSLSSLPAGKTLHLVVGVQGAGKSTWINQNKAALGRDAVFFDAALPRAKHRERAVSIAKACGAAVICVWVQATLEAALQRNAARPCDHRVTEEAVRSVFSMFEPPSLEEGFIEIRSVDSCAETANPSHRADLPRQAAGSCR